VPPLLLADGEALVQITMRDGVRITTAPLSRRRLTPSVSGVDAAAEVLATTAAEVAAATQSCPTTPDR